MFSADKVTEFLSFQTVKHEEEVDLGQLVTVSISLGEQHNMLNRRVYEQMTLLGDLGGLFEAFFIIAIGVHYLAVENTLPAKLLQHYFLVDNDD